MEGADHRSSSPSVWPSWLQPHRHRVLYPGRCKPFLTPQKHFGKNTHNLFVKARYTGPSDLCDREMIGRTINLFHPIEIIFMHFLAILPWLMFLQKIYRINGGLYLIKKAI